MDPITVRFNGPLYVQDLVEVPDESLTVGEYVDSVIEAHGVLGEHGHEVCLFPSGEPVPAETPILALSGETVVLRTLPAPEAAPADVGAPAGQTERAPRRPRTKKESA